MSDDIGPHQQAMRNTALARSLQTSAAWSELVLPHLDHKIQDLEWAIIHTLHSIQEIETARRVRDALVELKSLPEMIINGSLSVLNAASSVATRTGSV